MFLSESTRAPRLPYVWLFHMSSLPYVSHLTSEFIGEISTHRWDTNKINALWLTIKIFPMHITSQSRMFFSDMSCTFKFFFSQKLVFWALHWASVPWLFIRSNELLKHIKRKKILSTKSYVPEEDLSELKGLVDLPLEEQKCNILPNKYLRSQVERHTVIQSEEGGYRAHAVFVHPRVTSSPRLPQWNKQVSNQLGPIISSNPSTISYCVFLPAGFYPNIRSQLHSRKD